MSVATRGKDPMKLVRKVLPRGAFRLARKTVNGALGLAASARYGRRYGKLPPEQRPYVAPREYERTQQRWQRKISRAPIPAERYRRMRRPIEIEEFIACHLCGSADVIPMFHPRGRDPDGSGWSYYVVRCAACGLLYRNPNVKPHRLGDLYATDYSSYLAGDYAKKRLRRYKLTLDAWAPLLEEGEGRRLLDFGCGIGLFLEMAHERGFDTYGTDLSPDSIEQARTRKGGQNAYYGHPLEIPEIAEGGFHVITMWSVLAHLARPLEDLQMLRSLLAPDGMLMIFTVNANSLQLKRYGSRWNGFAKNHLTYFTTDTLTRALSQAGFAETHFRKFYGDSIEAGTTRLAPELVQRMRRIIDETDQGNMMRAVGFVSPQG